jgi:hypothetical protein
VWWLQSVLPRDVPRQLHNKLDSVSFSDLLIEYDGGGHRVLSDGTHKVKVCRDTDFLEEPVGSPEPGSSEPTPKRERAELRVDGKMKTGGRVARRLLK